MTSNITNRPKLTNGVPNAIFNNTDFGTSDDVKYIKRSGDVMSGSLTLPSLVCNGAITLPSAYSVAPTISQIGGNSGRLSWAETYTTAWTVKNLRSFTVEQGNYLLIYRVALNNATANVVTIDFFTISISTANNAVDEDYRISNMGVQSVGNGGNTALSGCVFYQNVSGTQKTLYLNYFTTTSIPLIARGYVQVVRIG